MSFYEIIKEYPIEKVKDMIYNAEESQIINALKKDNIDEYDLAALISPKASSYLDEMANISHNITMERFGKTIRIYAPIYLSNHCVNTCTYCGFSRKNSIPRITLTLDEIETEVKIVSDQNIKNVILVTGDHMKKFTHEALVESVKIASKYIPFVSIEVPSLTYEQYADLVSAGANGLTMFQETYIEEVYPKYHTAGPKKNYLYRLDTPERAASSGMRQIGLGALLGLTDYRLEIFYLSLHAKYIAKKYWRTQVSVSFPRIRKAAGEFHVEHEVSDIELLQSIFAFRMFMHDASINISTRENPAFRDKLVYLGATIMSAGSKTEPGGYAKAQEEASQFIIEDNRSIKEFCDNIKKLGYDPVMKDWQL